MAPYYNSKCLSLVSINLKLPRVSPILAKIQNGCGTKSKITS